ncbi:MAG TPA: hypothetical protein VN764_05705 [Polyangiaceae bacterium]|nr:hypothetical protein [Polyangiaceae bacterium]
MHHPLNHSPLSKLNLLRDTRGLSTVEYIILLVLLAVGCITAWSNFRETVIAKVQDSDQQISEMQ